MNMVSKKKVFVGIALVATIAVVASRWRGSADTTLDEEIDRVETPDTN